MRKGGELAPAVGVIVNRVDLARDVFNQLREVESSAAVLLIGRSRAVGRDQIVETLAPFRTGAPRVPDEAGPLFVVATQCLEVGVDLDLDGLVTQAASLDALRQRFGRLNRAGRSVQAAGAILALAEDIAKKADDPVYGDRLVRTWEALKRMARNDEVDFGIEAFDARRKECAVDVETLAAPRAASPVLMPAYLDLWSQTSPPPTADPDVGLFLHGVDRTSAGVSIVWRSDITRADLAPNAADLKTLLTLVPPRAEEMVEVPLWSARAWLRRDLDRDPAGVSDAPERDRTEESEPGAGPHGRWGFRWAGADDPRTGNVSPSRLQPGDVLVVPAEYGGCDEFGWAPASAAAVVDVADAAARPFRTRRHAVRIARDVARDDAQWERLRGILADEGAVGTQVERLLEALPAEPGRLRTPRRSPSGQSASPWRRCDRRGASGSSSASPTPASRRGEPCWWRCTGCGTTAWQRRKPPRADRPPGHPPPRTTSCREQRIGRSASMTTPVTSSSGSCASSRRSPGRIRRWRSRAI